MQQASKHDRTEFNDRALTDEDRAEVSRMPIVERQQMITNMICPHPLYDTALSFVKTMHMPVPGGLPNLGRISALYAPYRSGKSTAMKHAARSIRSNPDGTETTERVLYYRCHSNLVTIDFFSALYRSLMGFAAPRSSIEVLQGNIGDLMPERGCEMLMLDNLQAVMHRADMVRKINSFLIELLEKRVCHVLIAGPKELDGALRFSEEVEGRGGLLNPNLPVYDWHTVDGRKEYRRLLHRIDERLPFRRLSGLGSEQIAAHFFDMHGPAIGFALDIIYYAACLAMNERADAILPEHLAKVAALQKAPNDPFTHFVDPLSSDLVGRRKRDAKKGKDDV